MGRLFAGTEFYQPPTCDRCGKSEGECKCPADETTAKAPPLPPEKQTARLTVEKRKKGKSVTVVRGLSPQGNDPPELLSRLQAACGAGGTVKEDTLEIQGKHLERVRNFLAQAGFKTRG